MATSKYSHQRESIINFLTGRTDHPTADAVYQYLRNDLPTISLGTVYRNLNQMSASGRILRLHVDGKTDHYDACTDPHAHLLCTKCGAVRDIHMNFEDDLIAQAAEISPCRVDGVSVLFTGLCEECADCVDDEL